MRRAILTALAAGTAWVAGCTAPCDRIAARACEREQSSSRACQEARRAADYAGDEEQGYCRVAASVLESFPPR